MKTLQKLEHFERCEDQALEAFGHEGRAGLSRFEDRIVRSLRWKLLAICRDSTDKHERRQIVAALQSLEAEIRERERKHD